MTDSDRNELNHEPYHITSLLVPSTYKTSGKIGQSGATGVFGYASAGSGDGVGVSGQVDSPNNGATGVYGEAANSDGGAAADGVRGITRGTGKAAQFSPTFEPAEFAVGVSGSATNPDGIETYGVYGSNDATGTGTAGVFGKSFASTGQVYGVTGDINSGTDGAAGVWGDTNDSSGQTYGVKGTTASGENLAAGVKGEAQSTDGKTRGVLGITDSSDNFASGVRGEATQGSGILYGVSGTNSSQDDLAAGLHGRYRGTGKGWGTEGITDSGTTGTAGVRGEATDSSARSYGVYGVTQSSNGFAAGVYGRAEGEGDGVRAESASGQALFVAGVNREPGGTVLRPVDHAAQIVDFQSNNSSVLALRTFDTSPSTSDNFITFYDGNADALGRIESNNNGDGVQLQSGGADYAEFLPRADPDERLEPADVVGVVGGAVTRRTEGADQAMVVTDRAVVAGNSPGIDQDADGHETVAFVGQIPAKVRGTVRHGDLIVPSGEDDGVGRAVDPASWSPGDAPIVGRAWETSDDPGVTEVIVSVGIDDPALVGPAIEDDRERIEDVERENERLREELAGKDDRIAALETEVESLHEQLAAVDRRVTALADDGSPPTPADD